jgi:two-component system sensor histidine kinase/response regulator
VVEDNSVNQEVATGILENMDCRVVTAANGKCAVERFAHDAFDLVLMDCEMPVMDGFEATGHIRKIEAASVRSNGGPSPPRIPIVALTAHALAEIREQCLRSGMDDFLVKPFDELQIAEMLRRWIPSHEQAPREKTRPRAGPQEMAQDEAETVIDLSAINKIRAIPGKNNTSLFEQVASQFSDIAPTLAAAIRAQCDAGDAEALWRAAHSLKSSAAALGAVRLSRRCAQIEALARDSGAKPVCDLLDALEADLATAQNGLRELIGADHG